MSEYATRKIDNTEFKIGTCEDMFKCRYDQLGEITYPYMSDNLYWRIPTPDEDGTLPGDYNHSLLQEDGHIPWKLMIDTSKFGDDDIASLQQTGTIQLKEPKMGYLSISVVLTVSQWSSSKSTRRALLSQWGTMGAKIHYI